MISNKANKLCSGTADRILPHYKAMIDAALAEFCYKHWPCEHLQPTAGRQRLGANWDNDILFQANRPKLSIRCVSVRVGHGTRGHNLEDGSWVSGEYFSSF